MGKDAGADALALALAHKRHNRDTHIQRSQRSVSASVRKGIQHCVCEPITRPPQGILRWHVQKRDSRFVDAGSGHHALNTSLLPRRQRREQQQRLRYRLQHAPPNLQASDGKLDLIGENSEDKFSKEIAFVPHVRICGGWRYAYKREDTGIERVRPLDLEVCSVNGIGDTIR